MDENGASAVKNSQPRMPDEKAADQPATYTPDATARRALILCDAPEGDRAGEALAEAGYVVRRARAEDATVAAAEFSPSVALLVFGGGESSGKLVAAARRLRAAPETFPLPLVFLYERDERSLRTAAVNTGADDYFSQDSSPVEIRARLDALFWRAEVGRRSAPVAVDQRAEIDNFLFLLDAIAEDARRGGTGTLALTGFAEGDEGEGRSRPLAEAYGFLKLNLRRLDSVVFYGPTVLLVYLPGVEAGAAGETFARLRKEFEGARPGADLAFGLASFPADGSEPEELTEKAEAALEAARRNRTRVMAFRDLSAAKMAGTRGASASSAHGAKRMEMETFNGGVAAADSTRKVAGRSYDATAARPDVESAREVESAAGRDGRRRRLLLAVSDGSRMARLNLLLRSAGYEVRAAFDGEQALALTRIERPDLLVIDYELQGGDGMETLRRFSAQAGGASATPAVLLLPREYEGRRAEAVGIGATRVVSSPYDSAELLDSIRAGLGAA